MTTRKWLVFERGFSEPAGKVAESTGFGHSIVSALTERCHGKARTEEKVPTCPAFGKRFSWSNCGWPEMIRLSRSRIP
ncbi:MAG TPA: hypothetical protein VGK23_10200 [Methanomassiliicoccales archaeon]